MTSIREASHTVTIAAPAPSVWQKICEPCSILQWNDRIAKCTPGQTDQGQIVRHYVLHPIGPVVPKMVETELSRLDPIMMITYSVEIQDLPVSDYIAQILVTPVDADSCEVCIRSRFIDTGTGPDAQELVTGFYQVGLGQLSALMSP